MREELIVRRIEPFLHILPLAAGLGTAIPPLFMEMYNPTGTEIFYNLPSYSFVLFLMFPILPDFLLIHTNLHQLMKVGISFLFPHDSWWYINSVRFPRSCKGDILFYFPPSNFLLPRQQLGAQIYLGKNSVHMHLQIGFVHTAVCLYILMFGLTVLSFLFWKK